MRFGYQFRGGTAAELRTQARDAEDAGFDVISSWDHVGEGWTSLLPLVAMAEATERIRVCPLVVNNDFHHPVHLAAEVANLDHLTGGRVELGIGAGHAFPEYAAIGQRFDPPAVRKARLAEAVEIIARLLAGDEVTWTGEHYRLEGVRTMRSLQERLPILVGVNGRQALAHAARHATTIGLTMLGRTLADGQSHEVRWEPARLDATVQHIRTSAADRDVELNALVQRVVVTDDREAAAEDIAATLPSLRAADALETPFLAIGTHDEMADHLRRCGERWGITYFTFRAIDAVRPVIDRLA